MTKSTRAAAAAALAISATFTPPATADNEDSFGFLCGLASLNDGTRRLVADPDHHFGVMVGGPLIVGDFVDDGSAGPSHTTATTGTLHCWIQVNSDAPGHDPSRTVHPDFRGHGVIAGTSEINYSAKLTDNVYLCAMLETHGQTYVYDDDNNTANGDQCSLLISLGG